MPPGRTIRGSAGPQRLNGRLGDLLVAARGDRPRSELAAAAGVHPNTLGDLEKGRANPTLALLENIGPVYGVELDLVARPTDGTPR